MGKKSSKTTVESYKPTAEEVRLQKQAADYADAVAPNALKLNDWAFNVLNKSYGTVQADYGSMNKNAQDQIAASQQGVADLAQGKLPQAYVDNMQATIGKGMQGTMGNLLNNLSQRGVLNSSVTSKGIQGMNEAAADAMNKQYLANISALSQLYGQQAQGATANIAASAAAQEAALRPGKELWGLSIGLNNGGTMGALNAIAGQGQKTMTQSGGGGGGLFGGILTGLSSNPSLFARGGV